MWWDDTGMQKELMPRPARESRASPPAESRAWPCSFQQEVLVSRASPLQVLEPPLHEIQEPPCSSALTLPPRSVQLNHPVNEAYVRKPLALRLSDGVRVSPLVCKYVGGYPVSFSMCRFDAVGSAASISQILHQVAASHATRITCSEEVYIKHLSFLYRI